MLVNISPFYEGIFYESCFYKKDIAKIVMWFLGATGRNECIPTQWMTKITSVVPYTQSKIGCLGTKKGFFEINN